MTDTKGKWALITGASRGIGREIALFMAEQGCNLILHSRKIAGTEEIKKKSEFFGVKVYSVEADFSDISSVGKMLELINSMDIVVDFVFNNAGIQPGYREDYYSTPASDYEISFLINTIVPMKICYYFIPKMIARGFGRIINTTSGIENEPQQAGYSAGKAALDKVTKDLAGSLIDTGVMLCLTDPGWCRSDMGGTQAPNDSKSALPGVALGAFADFEINGELIRAQEYSGLKIEEAIKKLKEKTAA
ncbi:MAG: SDR family oxidoreductase [Clostridia bacterium]|nr:SDR family oxidoreductase [Clostridia bacterium]